MPFSINPLWGCTAGARALLCSVHPSSTPRSVQRELGIPSWALGVSWKLCRFPLAESPGRLLGFEFPELELAPLQLRVGL